MTELKIKLAEGATMPSKANESDSGYDLTATSVRYDEENGFLEYGTGVFLHIPEGYQVKLYSRSSISKYDLVLANGVGVVDESYRRELLFRFKILFPEKYILEEGELRWESFPTLEPSIYKVGDKIGQMMLEKREVYSLTQVDNVEDTSRGGFGSSDLPYFSGNLTSKDYLNG